MKAIITRKNAWGEFDTVGMNNRYMTSSYKTEAGLLRHGIADHFKGEIRVELFTDTGIYGDPFKLMYITKA